MVISQSKKEDFAAFSVVNSEKNIFDVRWGYEDVIERVGKVDEKTGQLVLTDKAMQTSVCTYEIHRFYGSKPTSFMLTDIFAKGSRIPNMSEMRIIGEAIGMKEEQMIPWMKEQLKRAVKKYDKSKAVENFTIGGVDVWMDKETRTGLLLRFQAEKAIGKTDTVLWHDGMQFPLVVDNAIQMLYAIEVYASATYDKTAEHLANVDKLESVDALIAYDFKAGYPAQLAF